MAKHTNVRTPTLSPQTREFTSTYHSSYNGSITPADTKKDSVPSHTSLSHNIIQVIEIVLGSRVNEPSHQILLFNSYSIPTLQLYRSNKCR